MFIMNIRKMEKLLEIIKIYRASTTNTHFFCIEFLQFYTFVSFEVFVIHKIRFSVVLSIFDFSRNFPNTH